MHAIFGYQLGHRAFAFRSFQRHTGFKPRVMVPAFLHVLISSFLETSRRQIIASVTVQFSGNSSLLRALTQKRAQFVEMYKRLLTQIRTELTQQIESLIKELEDRIPRAIARDERLSETAGVQRSIPGISQVASTMLIAEMPEIGTTTGEQTDTLTGLAPVARDSGTLRGNGPPQGGHRDLTQLMLKAALVAANQNPNIRCFADRLRKACKVVITAVAKKLVTMANALCKTHQECIATAP